MASSGNSAERQNQTQVSLKSGQYLVVPTTTGCKFAQGLQYSGGPPVALVQEREAEGGVGGGSGEGAHGGGGGGGGAAAGGKGVPVREFSPEVAAALNEMFRRLDADLDGLLLREELNTFMQMTEACSMTDEVYDWLINKVTSLPKTQRLNGHPTWRVMRPSSNESRGFVRQSR